MDYDLKILQDIIVHAYGFKASNSVLELRDRYGAPTLKDFQSTVIPWIIEFYNNEPNTIAPLHKSRSWFMKVLQMIRETKDLSCIFDTEENSVKFSEYISPQQIQFLSEYAIDNSPESISGLRPYY